MLGGKKQVEGEIGEVRDFILGRTEHIHNQQRRHETRIGTWKNTGGYRLENSGKRSKGRENEELSGRIFKAGGGV